MINISELMALAESSTGFYGGSGRDEMPELSLTEATAALPLFITEAQMKWCDDTEATNAAIVETTMNALRYGAMDESAMDAITEASLEGIKNKVIEFFNKILKFLKSILEKLAFQINRIRMTGKQLWAKYKNSSRAKNYEAFKDYKYNGYKNMFGADKVSFAKAAEYDSPNGGKDLIVKAVGDIGELDDIITKFNGIALHASAPQSRTDPNTGIKEPTEKVTGAWDAEIEKMREMDSSEIKAKMAEALTGESGLDSDWQTTVREKLYGDKEDLEYGKDFTIDQVGKLCENPEDLSKMETEYKKFQNSVTKYKKTVTDQIDSINKKTKATDEKDANERAKNNAAVTYLNAYIDRLNDAYAVITEVKNLRVTYYKAKNDQARAILAQLLSRGGGKAKKSENSDSSFEDDELLMFEVD